ncbi:unnamed protein product [marine sediment metagenome]|uniref:Uncharacterized protein n=1 Tax=marine sediment metagenome TaxID=412755 RepID=X1TAK2_9ZZZZ
MKNKKADIPVTILVIGVFAEGEIDEENLYRFLINENVSGKQITYSEYLVGTGNLLQIHEGGFDKINFDNRYYVLMGIKSKVSKEKWIGGGIALGVLTLVALPATVVSTGIISGILFVAAGASAGNFVATVVEGESGNQYISPTIIEVNSEEFKDLNCKSITTLA